MSTKSNSKSKTNIPSHKQKFDSLQESIVMFVLANPALEREIVGNYLDRNGYVVEEEKVSDLYMRLRGVKVASNSKHLAWTAQKRAAAEKLYQCAQKIRKVHS